MRVRTGEILTAEVHTPDECNGDVTAIEVYYWRTWKGTLLLSLPLAVVTVM